MYIYIHIHIHAFICISHGPPHLCAGGQAFGQGQATLLAPRDAAQRRGVANVGVLRRRAPVARCRGTPAAAPQKCQGNLR